MFNRIKVDQRTLVRFLFLTMFLASEEVSRKFISSRAELKKKKKISYQSSRRKQGKRKEALPQPSPLLATHCEHNASPWHCFLSPAREKPLLMPHPVPCLFLLFLTAPPTKGVTAFRLSFLSEDQGLVPADCLSVKCPLSLVMDISARWLLTSRRILLRRENSRKLSPSLTWTLA